MKKYVFMLLTAALSFYVMSCTDDPVEDMSTQIQVDEVEAPEDEEAEEEVRSGGGN